MISFRAGSRPLAPCQWAPRAVNRKVYYYSAARGASPQPAAGPGAPQGTLQDYYGDSTVVIWGSRSEGGGGTSQNAFALRANSE